MEIKSALSFAIKNFKEHSVKSPHLEAEILLSYALHKLREYILTHPEYKLSKLQMQKFKTLTKKRLANYPLPYLIGHKEFYGFNFFVDKNVLIPRPETELIIDEVIKITENNRQKYTYIDVGTGSGCIIITIAKLFKPSKFYGIDISNQAIQIAKKNARLNQVAPIKFLRGNLLKPLFNLKFDPEYSERNPACADGSKLIIIANLPYLTPQQIASSPSIQREPKLALVAGQDGLKYYRQLLQQISKNNLNFNYLLLEIDPSQKNAINRLLKSSLPDASWQIKKDLKGHNRLVVIKKQ